MFNFKEKKNIIKYNIETKGKFNIEKFFILQ